MTGKHQPHRAKTTAELRVLASPARQEFVSGLQALQTCTMYELGAQLGRPPASLYYHLRKLEEVGLVVVAGERATERGTEALYRLRSREIRVEPDDRRGANLAALRKIGAGFFRVATRLHNAAVKHAPERVKLRRRHLMAQQTLRLSPSGLERVNRKILELLDVLGEEEGTEGNDFYTVTIHLAPNGLRGAVDIEK